MVDLATESPGQRVRRLASRYLDAIRTVVDRDRPTVLVDFPDYGNIGDSAIFLGQLAALAALGLPAPRFISGSRSWNLNEIRELAGGATLLLSGGGSFGGAWPEFHERRLALLWAFPENPVVQLPQSIWFRDTSTLDATRQAVRAHPSFQLFVRDRESARLALEALEVQPILCPDAAFVLGAQQRPILPSVRTLWLMRRDQESLHEAFPDMCTTVDWTQQPLTPLRVTASLLARSRRRLAPSRALRKLNRLLYQPLAEKRLQRGLRLLSTAEVVVTDRLHGHILCLLLGIPHVLLDTRHGKLSAFHRTWTRDIPGVEFARDWEDARSRVESGARARNANAAESLQRWPF